MYRILIVDDEPHVVDWLYELLNDINYIELDIYRAYTSSSAVERFKKTKIDILLSDINMPKINGLQLMEKVLEEWPECRVVFLTGYKDFEYAYKAIHQGVVEYILKTEEDDLIVKAIEKAVSQIEESIKIKEISKKAHEQLKCAIPLLRNEVIYEIIEDSDIDVNKLESQFEEAEIPLNISYPVILLLGRVDNPVNQTTSERNSLIYGIDYICKKFISTKLTSVISVQERWNMLWILQPKETLKYEELNNEEDKYRRSIFFLRETLEMVQSACRDNYNQTISFVLGSEPYSWGDISIKHSMLRNMLYRRLGPDNEMLMTDKGFSLLEKEEFIKVGSKVKEGYNKLNKIDAMSFFLERGQRNKFYNTLNELIECFEINKSFNCNPMLEIYYSIALMLLSYINRRGLTEKIAFKIGLNKLMRIQTHKSWLAAADYLRSVADIILSIENVEQESDANKTIDYIREYIINNIDKDISLDQLADLVFFNPSYLSRLFKQVTGNNIKEYISEIKLKRAKTLLGDNDKKIYEVASSLGYNSSSYFTRFFRKMTGLNPQEYRDIIIKGNGKATK